MAAEHAPGLLLDVVDEAWMMDKLPDDDVPLPAGVAQPTEESAEDSNQPDKQNVNEDKWNELGLHTIQ
jgi:anaphase-promoting complex subunit 13